MFFVLLQNPSNQARFALVENGDQTVALFDDVKAAEDAAMRTLFGNAGYYEIFNLGDSL